MIKKANIRMCEGCSGYNELITEKESIANTANRFCEEKCPLDESHCGDCPIYYLKNIMRCENGK